jgi:putative transposase
VPDSAEFKTFPQRLHHAVPPWVQSGSYFHIRLRVARDYPGSLIEPETAHALLNSVQHYHRTMRWYCQLFLLMPDHAHALVAFALGSRPSRVVGEWKHYTARKPGIRWQPNFFDHRIRSASSLAEKHGYILNNPVVKQLCVREEDWLWKWTPEG